MVAGAGFMHLGDCRAVEWWSKGMGSGAGSVMTGPPSAAAGATRRRVPVLRGLVFGVVLVNAFVIALVALGLGRSRDLYRQQAAINAENISGVLEENLAGTIDRIDFSLFAVQDEIRREVAAGGVDRRALETFLARQDARLPETLGLRVVDAQGVIRYAVTGVVVAQASIADRPQFIRMRDNPRAGLVISRPVFGRAAQKWMITLSRRLDNPDGSFAGDVHVAVAVDTLARIFSALNVGPHGVVSLWNDKPTLLARLPEITGGGNVIAMDPVPSPQFQAILQSGAGFREYHAGSGVDGIERIFFPRRLRNAPLWVNVGVADEDYLAAWRRQVAQMAVLAGLFLLATVLATWLVYRGWRSHAAAAEAMARQEAVHTRALERDRDDAEEAARAKAEFLATMSHEIRTPMHGVLGMLDLLRDSDLQAHQRDWVETAHHSAEALLSILNDILDLSKLEAGRVRIEAIDYSPGRLAQGVSELFASRAAAKGLALAVEIPPDLPAFVRGDPTRVRQILLNLMGNAVKFTDRGCVTLSIERAAAPAGRVGLRFSVADTGIGILDDVQPRLFSGFTQADSSITRRFGGTGLGLAICKRLIELMGGSIGFHSEPGAGSTFWFELHPEPSDGPVAVPGIAPPPVSSVFDVLLAEDNPVNQKVATAILTRRGHRVQVAANGVQAVEMARGGGFDLILMDLHMPAMDGLEATRRIRELPPPVGATPIIAMTANALSGDEERCLAAGMDGYLAKPVGAARLERVIFDVLRRKGAV